MGLYRVEDKAVRAANDPSRRQVKNQERIHFLCLKSDCGVVHGQSISSQTH